jgi:AraC-like DNA-binding protein
MRISLYFILLFSTMLIFAQSKKSISDEKYVLLQEKVRALSGTNLDSSFVYANQIEKSENEIHKVFAFGAKSYLYQLKNDSISSKQFYEKGVLILKKIKPSLEKMRVYSYVLNFAGLADLKRGNLSLALDKLNCGKSFSLKLNDQRQVIKFNKNIAIIYGEIGNHKQAIKIYRQSNQLSDKLQSVFTNEQFMNNKNSINFNLGIEYEESYFDTSNKLFLLDSAKYFLNKSIVFSIDPMSKLKSKLELSSIYRYKNDFKRAEKTYLEIIPIAKLNGFEEEYLKSNFNLGILYFEIKKFDKSLVCLKKVDSIHRLTKQYVSDYVYSNYIQAKIYDFFHDSEKSIKSSKIFIESLESSGSKLEKEKGLVNSILEISKFKKEMLEIQEKTKMEFLYKKIAIAFIFILIVFLAFIFYRKHLENQNFKRVIEEYSQKSSKSDISDKTTLVSVDVEIKPKSTKSISIDEEKENEIVEKLRNLELKKEFLKMDFTQTFVAKKIKTNTTYLSYVVNKRFGKSFSEYANDLKINYVIEKLISDSTYRKYSTQAIAESVGFKNAISFTKSFSKKTGISPVQFAKKLVNNV